MDRFEKNIVTFETHDDQPWKHEVNVSVSDCGTMLLSLRAHEHNDFGTETIILNTPAQVDELISALYAARAAWFGSENAFFKTFVTQEWWDAVPEIAPGV